MISDRRDSSSRHTITCPVFEPGRVFEPLDVLSYISTTAEAINLKFSENIEIICVDVIVNFIRFKLDTRRQEKRLSGIFVIDGELKE